MKTLPILLFYGLIAISPLHAQTRTVMADVDGTLRAPDAATLAAANHLTQATGGPLYTHFFTVDQRSEFRGSESTPVLSTGIDAELATYNVTHAIRDIQLTPIWLRGNPADPVTWTSSDPTIATTDTAGLITWQNDGPVVITATVGNFSRPVPITMTSGATVETISLLSGRLGLPHLREAVTRPIDTAIAADAAALQHELYSTKDWAAHSYVRNASAWAYALTGGPAPWTALAVWRTGKTSAALGQSIRGTLISPDLIAFAWHNAPPVGTQYRYLDTDNVLHLRTLQATARIGLSDAGLGRLDSPLPNTVHPAKLLPADWQDRLSATGTLGLQLPAVSVNRNLRAMITEVYFHSDGFFGAGVSRDPSRQPYYFQPVNGDSGSPLFFVIGGQLGLLSPWYTPFIGADFTPAAVLPLAAALDAAPPEIISLAPYTNFVAPPAP